MRLFVYLKGIIIIIIKIPQISLLSPRAYQNATGCRWE